MWRSLCLLLVLLGWIAGPALAEPQLGDDVAACRARDGDAQARQDACERVISDGKAAPKDIAVAYGIRGEAFFKKRNFDKAIESYSKGAELDPDNVGMLNARGWAYMITGKDDLAIADYSLALQKRPNFAIAYNNRGLVYLRRGALQSALDDFNAALRIKNDMFFAHNNRGRVLAMNKDFDGAFADFAAAEQLNPTPPQPNVFRCVAYIDMGKLDDALGECNKALAKMPNYHFALCTRAEVYIAKGNLDPALKDLNTVLGQNPNYIRAHMDRGRLFEKRGDLAQAR